MKGKYEKVFKKTKDCCAHCGKKFFGGAKTVDHILPVSKGGTYDYRNLIPLCKECNTARGNVEIFDLKGFYIYASEEAILDYESYIFEKILGETGKFEL